jgi:DNA-binding SARP family transcriptional activator/tetratricopeptide (TPR) repeat protein
VVFAFQRGFLPGCRFQGIDYLDARTYTDHPIHLRVCNAMAGLELRFLGDIQVIQGNVPLELPPSRKTRGLLAFLALTPRPTRREQLCELLWEIPDDPRGSLRWSLSKLRKLVDADDCPRIIANRNTVAFDASAVEIDVVALHHAAQHAQSASEDELVRVAERSQGSFLEGLDLTDFHDFHAWCIGERERVVRAQAALMGELGKRLAQQPERALPFALTLVALTPFEESPRAELIRLLMMLGRQEEARHQLRVGREKLAEVGIAESGALGLAMREPRRPPSKPRVVDALPTPQESSLVGRTEELTLLAERINNLASTRTARLLLIRGEPGIGKSSLLQVAAAMARTAGARLFKASAFESEMIRPFGVWSDALRRSLPDTHPARQLLAASEQTTREQVYSSLAEIFTTETGKHPVVVLCDDVQWADESSFNALHYLLRNYPGQPLLFIAASREQELSTHTGAQAVIRGLRGSDLIDEIRLGPLAAPLIEHLIRRQYPDADAGVLAAECGGNPLLALELARAGVEGGRSLSELVSERVSHLDANAQAVLHWAAVLAPQINFASLENASKLERAVIDAALEQAEQRGILHPGERGLRFSHDLIRKCIYDSLSPARRCSMHRHVALLLEVDARVDLELAAALAHHARLSGEPHLAGKAMVSAGKLCIRFYDNDKAMELYHEGRQFAAQLNDAQRICLDLELGEVRLNAAPIEDWQTQVDEFVSLAEQAMDHGSAAHARLGYQMASYLRWAHGEVRGAKRFSLQAERVSRGTSDAAQILGMAEAAKCLAMLERDLSRADAMVMEARALAQRVDFQCAAIPLGQAILRYYEEKFDEAVDFLEDARTLAKSDGDRLSEYMANEYLTIVEMERDDYEAAFGHACHLVDIGERIREGSERPFAHVLQAVCRFAIAGEDAALEPALRELRIADAKQRVAFVLNRASVLYLENGKVQKACDYASEALELARIMERPSEILQACITLERIYRRDAGVSPHSYSDQIKLLANGDVARLVKRRSAEFLCEPT